MPLIKTPDQRLRVFISSTIQELAAERGKVREVVESMKLIPVFFESGARPHPPRDLYRSYLEQSDVFVGIYWKSYGWVAPDMEISGLEDEWRLSQEKPKLIYIKHSDDRDPKLDALIHDIQDSNTACYQRFESVEQLVELLSNDLALLLTERFQSSELKKEESSFQPKSNLPVLRTEIVGRTEEIKSIEQKFALPSLGLITLVGPGGTGKTRLALEVGKVLVNKFPDGVFFVRLSGVTDGANIPVTIAQTIGMINKGNPNVGNWVLEYLFDKSLLLILDNLEQISDAGFFISDILNKCSSVKILATSRTPLYIRSENIFSVEPLEIKSFVENGSRQYPSAVTLFLQRAGESNPAIHWNDENLKAAYSICRKLDGLPLGIELAAARCRHFAPSVLDRKMETILNTVGSGPRDYPERQQTLRNTIQWSYNLLEPADQRLFRRLSVFENGWSFDAVGQICWNGFDEIADLETSVEHLCDFGLTIKIHSDNDYKTHRLLQLIKEYALEKLQEAGEEEKLRDLHCEYFQNLAQSNAEQIWMTPVNRAHFTFREDYENIVGAFNHAVNTNDQRKIWMLINSLNALYLIKGEIGFLFEWLEKGNIKSDEENLPKMLQIGSKAEVAVSLLSAGFIRSTTGNFREGLRDLEVSRQFAKEAKIPAIESRALLFLGIAHISIEYFEKAKEYLNESIAICKEQHYISVRLTAEITLNEAWVVDNKIKEAIEHLDDVLSKLNLEFMPLVESYAYYRRAYLHYYLKEYEQAIRRFQQSIDVNKKYNLNLNASLPLMGLAMTYTEILQFKEALVNFQQALECVRLSGSTVEYECFRYAFCHFLAKTGQTENALRLFAAIKKEYKISHFRPWITHRICLEYAEQILLETYDAEFVSKCIEDASELSREEIYAMVRW